MPFVVNGKLALTSPATANPNPATTGQQITFTAAGIDGSGNALSVSWNFGDGTLGTSGASVTHTYVSAQNYLVTATMSDAQGKSIQSSVMVTVNPQSGVLTVTKVTLRGKSPSIGKDVISISGLINFPSTITSISGPVTISIGSVSTTFTLNAKGIGKTGINTFKFVKLANPTNFVAKISSDFSGVLIAAGVPAGGSGRATIPVTISFGNANYNGTASMTVTTKKSTVVGK